MGKLRVESDVLGAISTNCYYLINTETKEVIIVDPADDAFTIKSYCLNNGLTVRGILLTHGHFDHILAADELRKYFDVKIYAGEHEKALLNDASKNLSAAWAFPYTLDADVYLGDGEHFELAGFNITAIHTPGHTKGGMCYYIRDEKALLSGDTLFCCSYGRTDFPTSSMRELIDSICTRLLVLPDDVKVYPGHDEQTDIGFEKLNNPMSAFLANYE
ncbi:MAG: MBL fold metallo-hydrolase [Lachnospiraceae bacterium]|nr:MBL fold metallo-hydrolase [Lachnospiraceae bacterium]